jgi:hypothetical protein
VCRGGGTQHNIGPAHTHPVREVGDVEKARRAGTGHTKEMNRKRCARRPRRRTAHSCRVRSWEGGVGNSWSTRTHNAKRMRAAGPAYRFDGILLPHTRPEGQAPRQRRHGHHNSTAWVSAQGVGSHMHAHTGVTARVCARGGAYVRRKTAAAPVSGLQKPAAHAGKKSHQRIPPPPLPPPCPTSTAQAHAAAVTATPRHHGTTAPRPNVTWDGTSPLGRVRAGRNAAQRARAMADPSRGRGNRPRLLPKPAHPHPPCPPVPAAPRRARALVPSAGPQAAGQPNDRPQQGNCADADEHGESAVEGVVGPRHTGCNLTSGAHWAESHKTTWARQGGAGGGAWKGGIKPQGDGWLPPGRSGAR